MQFDIAESFGLDLDERDPLRRFRSEFHIPTDDAGRELIYFVGHSLGLQPRSTRSAVEEELTRWAEMGVAGHFRGPLPWTRYHEVLGPLMSPIVGASPAEIVVMNALTVNLHHMMISFYRPSPGRFKILMEDHAFPSDRYAVVSQCLLHGYDPDEAIVTMNPRSGEHTPRTEDVLESIRTNGREIALILLGGVNYYTGQLFDLQAVTREGRRAGCVVGFDLAHAAGNVELRLHDWGVDFAVWCCYKYLNGGPGSLAGCFVHERHAGNNDIPRLQGWWGESLDKRFQMSGGFEPMRGAAGWQMSNPNVLSLACIRASLEIFRAAGLPALRSKQRLLTSYLEFLLTTQLPGKVQIITPSDPDQRGSQLSLLVSDGGHQLYEHLLRSGIVCDWRNPNVIRAAPVPLYNTFHEVWRFVQAIVDC